MPARPRKTSDTMPGPAPADAGRNLSPYHRHAGPGTQQGPERPLLGTGTGYLVGLGSNLQPERNIPVIIRTLVLEFGGLGISPVIRTRPVGIHSRHDFLNAVVYVETDLSADRLKAFFNDLEERLGRDRSDRARRTKDRPADLDILLHCQAGRTLDEALFPTESYLRPPFLALCETMGLIDPTAGHDALQTVALPLDGIEFGQHAQFLYVDGSGRIHDAADLREPALR